MGVHIVGNLVGSVCFVVGSVLFVLGAELVSISELLWFDIVDGGGNFLFALGSAILMVVNKVDKTSATRVGVLSVYSLIFGSGCYVVGCILGILATVQAIPFSEEERVWIPVGCMSVFVFGSVGFVVAGHSGVVVKLAYKASLKQHLLDYWALGGWLFLLGSSAYLTATLDTGFLGEFDDLFFDSGFVGSSCFLVGSILFFVGDLKIYRSYRGKAGVNSYSQIEETMVEPLERPVHLITTSDVN